MRAYALSDDHFKQPSQFARRSINSDKTISDDDDDEDEYEMRSDDDGDGGNVSMNRN